MHFDNLDFAVVDRVAWIRFNRPQSLNALTRAMAIELCQAIELCHRNDGIRVVVLTGTGRAFSAGADVTAERPKTLEGELDLAAGLHQIYTPLILALRRLPKPVVAAVRGPAAGIGCSIACACDFIVAAESAYFLLAFVKVGLIPDGGSSLTIAARVGIGRATELALLGDRLSARQAHAWGLANKVWPDDDLDMETANLAARLAAGPTGAYSEMKALFNRLFLPALESQMAAEAAAQFRRGQSPEYAEGVQAFADKRTPDFASVHASR